MDLHGTLFVLLLFGSVSCFGVWVVSKSYLAGEQVLPIWFGLMSFLWLLATIAVMP